MSQPASRNAAHCPGWPLQPQRCSASRCAGRAFGAPLTLETSASPAGLTARARPEARPETRAANLSVRRTSVRKIDGPIQYSYTIGANSRLPLESAVKPEKRARYSERYTQSIEKFLASPETSTEFSRELFWQLKSESSDRLRRVGKWAFFGVIFICIFVLLERNFVTNLSFSGIQINRLNFLAYFLPPAVAFCLVNIYALEDEQSHYGYIMVALAKQGLPGLYVSRVHLLFPNGLGLLSGGIPKAFTTRMGRFNDELFLAAQMFIFHIGFLIFEAYAYVRLFSHGKHSNSAAFISLLVTASFIVIIALRIIDKMSDPAVEVGSTDN